MSDETNHPYEQAAAFQKIWAESMTKMAQAAFTPSSDSAPPELLREFRNGIFKALAQSWEEFMRSPQFLEAMRQMMKNAVSFRQMTSDVLGRARHEMQGTNRSDVDTLMLAIRHLETRLLDEIEALSSRVEALEPGGAGPKQGASRSSSRARSKKPGAKRRPATRPKPRTLPRKKRS